MSAFPFSIKKICSTQKKSFECKFLSKNEKAFKEKVDDEKAAKKCMEAQVVSHLMSFV